MRRKMFNRSDKKEIIFQEFSLVAKHLQDTPKPSRNSIPQWFKNDKNFSTGSNDELKALKTEYNGTYKMCVPVTDTMSAGYNIVLPATIFIINAGDAENYQPKITWQVDWNVCDTQSQDALQSYPRPHEHSPIFFRWKVDWKIITPSGYSAWITHPSHRYDLPFTTINGFVDTDAHPSPLLLPFFVKNGFEGKIDAGTPIAQVIPIKRDHWVSKRKDYDEEQLRMFTGYSKLDFFRTYRNRYWSKKTYE
jgi:hypothetical protein